MDTVSSFPARLRSALTFDRALYEEVEKDPSALWHAGVIVAVAGAGRGITPWFEGGWAPIVAYSVIGLVTWIFVSALVWNLAHRVLGYTEGFGELTRVFGFACAPLLGLWLNVVPVLSTGSWLSVLLHALALISLVLAIRAALEISLVRAMGVCALSVAAGLLLVFLIGLLLVGTPASGASEGGAIQEHACASPT